MNRKATVCLPAVVLILPKAVPLVLAMILCAGCTTPLQKAARTGNTEEVQRLLGQGADVNEKNAAGITALMEAANWGHIECARLLLDRGADIDAQYNGWTARTFAQSSGYTEIVDMLENVSRERVAKQVLQEQLQTAERLRNAPLAQLLETAEFGKDPFTIALTDKLIEFKNQQLPGFIIQSAVEQRIVLLNTVEKALTKAQAQMAVFNSQAEDAVRQGRGATEYRQHAVRIQACISVLIEIKNMLMQS